MNPPCARCKKTVYPTEKLVCLDKVSELSAVFTAARQRLHSSKCCARTVAPYPEVIDMITNGRVPSNGHTEKIILRQNTVATCIHERKFRLWMYVSCDI